MALHLVPAADPAYDHQTMPCCICHPGRTEGRRPDGTHGVTFTHRAMTSATASDDQAAGDAR